MRRSIWTRLAVMALAMCAVAALAAPAWGAGGDVDLRRDGSKAVPFVPDLRPGLEEETDTSPAAATAADGFHWGDAAIGAGIGATAVLLAAAGAGAARERRALRAS